MSRITRIAVATVVTLLAALAGVALAGPLPAGAEPTGGCRPVGGGAVAGSGSHRATVVVDTGSGPVWAACIEFTGTISGIEALELAAGSIPGLAPVYEPYPGNGRAVCQLLDVGNEPPGCMAKSVEYWSYFRNGSYARGGGSGSVVADGDVEGWSFSRGTPPRAATTGTEAVPASAVPATTAPAPPPSATPDPGPSTPTIDAAPSGDGASDQPTPPPPAGTPTSDPGAPGPDAPSTVEEADDPSVAAGSRAGARGAESGAAAVDGDDGDGETAIAVSRPSAGGGAQGGSGASSVLGFGAAMGAAALAAIGVRARRRHLS